MATGLDNLAKLYRARGNLIDAESCQRRAIGVYRKSAGDRHVRVAQSLHNLASTLRDQDKLAEAESVFRESLDILRESLPAGHPMIAMAQAGLGGVVNRRGRYAEAEPLLLGARADLADGPPSARTQAIKIREQIVALYEAWNLAEPGKGHDEQAAEWRAKLPTTQPTPDDAGEASASGD